MRSVPSKLPLFVFEALGSLACGFYGNYIFFLFRDRHGFGDFGNLCVAALMGLVIAIASWKGGKYAQRNGCVRAMFCGLFGMILALAVGACFPQLPVQFAVLVVWAASQFMIWPALESLVTEGETGSGRARLVGIYSVVWASCSALSYFFGGSVFERLGSGSIFWLPPLIHILQVLLLLRIAHGLTDSAKYTCAKHPGLLQPAVAFGQCSPAASPAALARKKPDETSACPARSRLHGGKRQQAAAVQGLGREFRPCPQSFQRMAWIANPFACVAAFTLLAMIPGLARKMGLSITMAGLFCSIWFFARLAAFVVMWQWPGWHYRFRWLLAGYILLIAGFVTVLTADGLLWLGLGQVTFGLAVGSLYYASLFYSMDVGKARAEQGGIHEALMGAGNFIGPGVGALSIVIAPHSPHAGVWSVSGLLAIGLALLVGKRLKGRGVEAAIQHSDP